MKSISRIKSTFICKHVSFDIFIRYYSAIYIVPFESKWSKILLSTEKIVSLILLLLEEDKDWKVKRIKLHEMIK